MWTKARALVLAFICAAGAATLWSGPAWAPTYKDFCDKFKTKAERDACEEGFNAGRDDIDAKSTEAAVSRPLSSVHRMLNFTATLQPGEPTFGGLMTRTVWTSFTAPASERIVIHTFGSTPWSGSGEFDTVLAAYRGTEFANLARLAGNDNRAVPGISGKHSLIQFNTVAGGQYHVQAGGRAQAEGDVSLNIFRFPPTGGLSAFLAQYGGNNFYNRDYICDFYTGPFVTTSCDSAKFIVHNSTGQTLNVTASSSLGPGVVAPAPFSLAPGALRVATFTFGAGFDKTTVRTVSGHFIFTGRSGATVVSQAHYRALVIARPQVRVLELVRAEASPTLQTGFVNVPETFTVKVINTGSVVGIGCHIRSKVYSDLSTLFQRIDPVTGAKIGAANEPLNIPPGQSRTFKVHVNSPTARDADFIDPEAIADCANNDRRGYKLRAGFDITVSALADPLPSADLLSATPANGILNVPAAGFAYYRARTINRGSTSQLRAIAYYERPFDDPANAAFTVSVCQTNPTTDACLAPYANEVLYTSARNTAATFKVRVKAPAGSPVFDPDKRRVYVIFKQAGVPYLPVGAPSIAVRKQ